MTEHRYLPFKRVLQSDVPGWPPDRAMARQAYIALVHGRLVELGWTQRDLAARLDISAAFISQVLTPLAEMMPRGFRTPPLSVANRIALFLWPEPEKRELFRELVASATSPASDVLGAAGRAMQSAAVVESVLADVRALRELATFTRDPDAARLVYHQLWEASSYAVALISPSGFPTAFAEALMLLHDAACILNRADVALLCAHRATIALQEASDDRRTRDRREWLNVSAARAETVALNHLGHPAAALAVSLEIEVHSPGYRAHSRYWALHVKTDQLSAYGRMAGGRQFDARDARATYAQARAESDVSQIGATLLDNAFARALIAHGGGRSLKEAEPLVELGIRAARSSAAALGPLHRAILLRTAARFAFRMAGDGAESRALLAECRAIVQAARLKQQLAQL